MFVSKIHFSEQQCQHAEVDRVTGWKNVALLYNIGLQVSQLQCIFNILECKSLLSGLTDKVRSSFPEKYVTQQKV